CLAAGGAFAGFIASCRRRTSRAALSSSTSRTRASRSWVPRLPLAPMRETGRARTPRRRADSGAFAGFASQRARREIVEEGDRVRFRPQADLARVTERAVVVIDDLRAIPVGLEVVTLGHEPVFVPRARRHLAVPPRDLLTFAVLDEVEAHVVLERVGP